MDKYLVKIPGYAEEIAAEIYCSSYELGFRWIGERGFKQKRVLLDFCISFDFVKFRQMRKEDPEQDITVLCCLCLTTTFHRFQIIRYPSAKIIISKDVANLCAINYFIPYIMSHILDFNSQQISKWFDQVWDYLQITIKN